MICAFAFCTCKYATQVFGNRFDQFIFLYKDYLSIASPCSYTAKFVLDLFKIPKGKFYHDEAHMSNIIQYNYSYLAWKLMDTIYTIYYCFKRVTKYMQVH